MLFRSAPLGVGGQALGPFLAPPCLGAESVGTPDARTIYYNYPTSGDGAVIGRLDKSGDVSGLASRHGDSTWRAGGPMRRFRKKVSRPRKSSGHCNPLTTMVSWGLTCWEGGVDYCDWTVL